jgi:hypothetical protein
MNIRCKMPLLIMLHFVFFLVLGQGCKNYTSLQTKQNKMTITGTWKKTSISACSEKYPDKLEFNSNGRYTAEALPNSKVHPIWDGGQFTLGKDSINMQTSYDAYVDYFIVLKEKAIFLQDTEGCAFEYEKVNDL